MNDDLKPAAHTACEKADKSVVPMPVPPSGQLYLGASIQAAAFVESISKQNAWGSDYTWLLNCRSETGPFVIPAGVAFMSTHPNPPCYALLSQSGHPISSLSIKDFEAKFQRLDGLLSDLEKRSIEAKLLIEAWTTIANVSNGKWEAQSEAWRMTARTWTDGFHRWLARMKAELRQEENGTRKSTGRITKPR